MSPEQEEIVRALKRMFADRAAARNAAENGLACDRTMLGRLAELGLTGLVVPPEMGGSGGSLADEAVVAECLAEIAAPVPFISLFVAGHILAAGEGEAAGAAAEALAGGAEVVIPCLSAGSGVPAGLTIDADGRLSGSVADVIDGAAADRFLVPVDGVWWSVAAEGEAVERSAVPTIDPTRTFASVTFNAAPAQRVSAFDPAAAERIAWTLLGAEASGVASAALDLARGYALERKQFGEVIGRFQAIKHKLSNALIAVEGARSATFLGVTSAAGGVPERRAAHMAKTIATAAGVSVCHDAIQIHGAIGNTWEHDLHLLLRRAKYCQLVLGSSESHMSRLAADLIAAPPEKARAGNGIAQELSLEPEDRAFLEELQAWLDEHATRERVREVRTGGVPAKKAWQAEMDDAGWVGIHWPREHGGKAASFIQQVLYHSELNGRGLPGLVGNRGLSLIGPTLIAHGTSDQKQRLLNGIRRGEVLFASGFSEPGAGSDLASLRCRGEVDGDHIVINGQKTWTSQAQFSDYLYTLIRTGPLHPKHGGISCVMVPLDSPGLTIRPIRQMNGRADFNEVFFDNVRVSLDNVVGALNEGWRVTQTTLSYEHMTNFLGTQLRHAFLIDGLVRRLAEHEAAGRVDLSLRNRAASAWINTRLLRTHGLRNIFKVVEGQDPGAEGSIMKLFGQEEEQRIWELAVDVDGAAGLTEERNWRNYLGARAATVGGGTSEVHRNKIAERVLGMPRDPWADDAPARGPAPVSVQASAPVSAKAAG